jgi:hypothetical protein
MLGIYRTALADTCDRLVESYNQIVRLAATGQQLDAGVDECLGIAVAAEQMEESSEALLRVTQELKVRAILREERAVNAEVAAARARYQQAQARLVTTTERVRAECKAALQDIMAELAEQ